MVKCHLLPFRHGFRYRPVVTVTVVISSDPSIKRYRVDTFVGFIVDPITAESTNLAEFLNSLRPISLICMGLNYTRIYDVDMNNM